MNLWDSSPEACRYSMLRINSRPTIGCMTGSPGLSPERDRPRRYRSEDQTRMLLRRPGYWTATGKHSVGKERSSQTGAPEGVSKAMPMLAGSGWETVAVVGALPCSPIRPLGLKPRGFLGEFR
jgi:hypothetical protein